MSYTPNDEIRAWLIQSASRLESTKNKFMDCKRMSLGNFAIEGMTQDTDEINQKDPSRADALLKMDNYREQAKKMFDIGASNKALEQIKILIQQVARGVPDIKQTDVDPSDAALAQEYLKVRLGRRPRGCEAHKAMKEAVGDMLIGGIGFVWVGGKGRPSVDYVSPLNVFWDGWANSFADAKRVAVKVSTSVRDAAEIWGEEHFREELDAQKDGRNSVPVVDLLWYYDCLTDEGTAKVFKYDSIADEEPIVLDEMNNPHFLEVDGYRQSFLPVHESVYMGIGGVTTPIGLMEMMASDQAMIRMIERRMFESYLASVGFWSFFKDAYDSTEIDKFMRGEAGTVLTQKIQGSVAQWIQGPAVSAEDINLLNFFVTRLVAAGGANPYGSGQVVDVKYSSEVNAIQSQANLTASYVAELHAEHWCSVAANMLAFAKQYEKDPLSLRFDKELMSFGIGRRNGTIGRYLNLDGDFVISSADVQWENSDQKESRAVRRFNTATMLAAVAPNAPRIEAENVIRAFGVNNPETYFEAPAMAAPQQTVGADDIAASTAS